MSAARSLTFDTGALLALERADPRIRALLRRALELGLDVDVPAGVLAQAWRGGARQANVARLIADVRVSVPALDLPTAKAVGLLCGRSGHPDVVDVHVALHARLRGHVVVTTDPGDLRRVDPAVELIAL